MMTDSKNLLLDVPPELTTSIAAHLPGKDLLTLRLVSKDVAARTETTMLKAHFQHLQLLFSVPSSLKKGLDIVNSPVLRKAIRKVSIYHHRFVLATGPGRLKLTDLHPNTPVEIKREVRCSQWAIYQDLLEDQEKLVACDDDQRHVTDILRKLKSDNIGLEVVVAELNVHVDEQGRHYCREGRSNMNEFDRLAEYYAGDLVLDGEVDYRPLQCVLKAIKRARLQLAGFAAGGLCQQVPVHMFSDTPGFSNMQHSFSKLTSLKLCFERTPTAAHRRTESEDIASFVSFLQSRASSLKSLDLRMVEEPFDNEGATWNKIFGRMTKEVTLPVVESLKISNVTCDYRQCLKFFADHARRLKDYYLFDIRVTGCGPRLSHRKWKGKVKADLEQLSFPLGKGMILLHHELYEHEEYSDEESDVDVDDAEAMLHRAYPSMRALID